MARPRHILHVIDALDHGGAQQFLVLLAEGTDRRCLRMTVCVLQPNLEMMGILVSKGAEVFCCGRKRPSILKPMDFVSYILKNIADIVAFCRRERVDVVQCHLSDAELLGALAGRIAGVGRVLSTVHYPALLPERPPGDPRNLLRRIWTNVVYRCWTDDVVAVSEEIAHLLVHDFGINPGRVRVILNGIDVERFAPGRSAREPLRRLLCISDDAPVVLTVARLTPPKGHGFLLEAVSILRRRYPGIRLLLAGDGELRGSLEAQAASLGMQAQVGFLGSRSDVADLLASCDIFVLPSLSEGTSLALLEALAAGKPVVATAISGNQRVIQHGKTGYLVWPGSGVELAEGISHLLDRPAEARELGEWARQYVRERFDIHLTIARYKALWGVAPGRVGGDGTIKPSGG